MTNRRRRRDPRPYKTKPGRYGALYLYRIRYRDTADHDNAHSQALWAYDAEHALDRFYAGPDADGWEPVGRLERVRDKSNPPQRRL